MKNILIIGSGGREHALYKKLLASSSKINIHAIPGCNLWVSAKNNQQIRIDNISEIIDYCKKYQITHVIVGPEEPLVNGITDTLKKENIKVFGPTKFCAQLEGSKLFSKQIMDKLNIPTAKYLQIKNYDDLAKKLSTWDSYPLVLKSSNLAAGKGVLIVNSVEEALAYGKEIFTNKIYGSNNQLILEEMLIGEEYSLLAIVNDKQIYPLPIICDHKRIYDNDQGPNTGGVGIFNNPNFISNEAIELAIDTCIKPIVNYFSETNNPYFGVLFAGIMQCKDGPKVIEYNVRLGDPETEGIMHLLESDLVQNLEKLFNNQDPEFMFSKNNLIGVVLNAKGYPKDYQKKINVSNLKQISQEKIVFMGMQEHKDEWISTGGRVAMIIEASNNTFEHIYQSIYKIIKNLNLNLTYRSDIGKRNFK